MSAMVMQHEAKKVHGKLMHPLPDLDIGDFYYVPMRKMRTVSPYVSARGKELGRVFATRSVHITERLGCLVECAADAPNSFPATKVIRIG